MTNFVEPTLMRHMMFNKNIIKQPRENSLCSSISRNFKHFYNLIKVADLVDMFDNKLFNKTVFVIDNEEYSNIFDRDIAFNIIMNQTINGVVKYEQIEIGNVLNTLKDNRICMISKNHINSSKILGYNMICDNGIIHVVDKSFSFN